MAQIYEILVRMDRLKPDLDGVIIRTRRPDMTYVETVGARLSIKRRSDCGLVDCVDTGVEIHSTGQ